MTLDHAVALSLLENLPRVNLTERLKNDPELLERATPLLEQARAVRERAQREAIQVVAWNDASFPTSLATLTDLPPVLWYQGELAAAEQPAIAIVGSRAASAVAIETASRLSADVAAAGITVVSGLARGVDSVAHRAALRTGRTIAVLGSGLDRVYPGEHQPLAQEIARTGLVVSEFPPGAATATASLSDAESPDQWPVVWGSSSSRRPRNQGRSSPRRARSSRAGM